MNFTLPGSHWTEILFVILASLIAGLAYFYHCIIGAGTALTVSTVPGHQLGVGPAKHDDGDFDAKHDMSNQIFDIYLSGTGVRR